jgi:hypothetical protein
MWFGSARTRTDLAKQSDICYIKHRLNVLGGVMQGIVVRWARLKVQVLQSSK